jgi:hypothetical protein
MKISSKYKHFKHSTIMGDTFTLLDMRSSIIHTIWRYIYYPNMANLRRFEKQAQIKEIDTPKTDRLLSVSDRALFALPYAIMIAWPGGFVGRAQGVKKPKTYLIIEIIPFLVFYSYATKYHNRTSMFIPGYQCSNVYINVEKGASMNKDIQ